MFVNQRPPMTNKEVPPTDVSAGEESSPPPPDSQTTQDTSTKPGSASKDPPPPKKPVRRSPRKQSTGQQETSPKKKMVARQLPLEDDPSKTKKQHQKRKNKKMVAKDPEIGGSNEQRKKGQTQEEKETDEKKDGSKDSEKGGSNEQGKDRQKQGEEKEGGKEGQSTDKTDNKGKQNVKANSRGKRKKKSKGDSTDKQDDEKKASEKSEGNKQEDEAQKKEEKGEDDKESHEVDEEDEGKQDDAVMSPQNRGKDKQQTSVAKKKATKQPEAQRRSTRIQRQGGQEPSSGTKAIAKGPSKRKKEKANLKADTSSDEKSEKDDNDDDKDKGDDDELPIAQPKKARIVRRGSNVARKPPTEDLVDTDEDDGDVPTRQKGKARSLKPTKSKATGKTKASAIVVEEQYKMLQEYINVTSGEEDAEEDETTELPKSYKFVDLLKSGHLTPEDKRPIVRWVNLKKRIAELEVERAALTTEFMLRGTKGTKALQDQLKRKTLEIEDKKKEKTKAYPQAIAVRSKLPKLRRKSEADRLREGQVSLFTKWRRPGEKKLTITKDFLFDDGFLPFCRTLKYRGDYGYDSVGSMRLMLWWHRHRFRFLRLLVVRLRRFHCCFLR